MRRFIYFIGEPGSGKTTLVSALTAGHPSHPMPKPVPHSVYDDGGIAQIGVNRGDFSGTDALAMSIQPQVEDWLQQRPYSMLFAEGDRLSNGKFFRAVIAAGYDLRIAMCEAAMAITADRRRTRAQAMGRAEQDPTWLKGRASKVIALRREWGERVHRVNTNMPVDHVVGQVREAGCDPFAS